MLARVLMALSVSGAGMSLARADIDDAAARAQYLGRYEVSTGLRAIQRALYWTGFSGDESFEKVEEACWDAARMVKTDEQDLRDDACLTAAARAASPKIAYHRTRMLPGPGPSAGIGISFKADPELGAVVSDVYPDTPASEGGIRIGDLIVSAQGRQLRGLSLDEVGSLVRGQAGTDVSLEVRGDGMPNARTVRLVRRAFQAKLAYAQQLPDAFYIQLKQAGVSMSNAYAAREQIEMLVRPNLRAGYDPALVVLDLRGNTGGLVDALLSVATLFVPIEYVRMYSVTGASTSRLEPRSDADADVARWLRARDLLVLIDRQTGSGTEWLAETLKRQTGAVIAGEPSSGGLMVRVAHQVTDNSRIESDEGYLLSSGGGIVPGTGVTPDVLLTPEQLSDKPTGRAPAWLRGWTSLQWRAALALRDQRYAAHLRNWSGEGVKAPQRISCIGGVRMTLPPEFGARAALKQVIALQVGGQRWLMSAESIGNPDHGPIPDGLSLLGAPIGPAQAQVYASDRKHGAYWRHRGIDYKVEINPWAGDEPSRSDLLSAYASLLLRIRAQEDRDNLSSEPGSCLGDYFLPLPQPVSALSWSATLSHQEGAHDVVMFINGHYDSDGGGQEGAMQSRWVIDRQDRCGWRPVAAVSRAADVDWMVATREASYGSGDRLCASVYASTISPVYPRRGWLLQAGLQVRGDQGDLNSAFPSWLDRWRRSLDTVSVSPMNAGLAARSVVAGENQ